MISYFIFVAGEIEKTITSQRAGKVADEWLEFDNGCLCCSAKDAAMIALEALLKRRQDIDHIVIETSGMANPGSIVQKLWVDDALDCRAQLDGVVCMVDAVHGLARLDPASDGYAVEAAAQVALADIALINKKELVAGKQLAVIAELIRAVNPLCRIEFTSFSEIDLPTILDIGEYRRSQTRDPSDLLSGLNLRGVSHSAKRLSSFSIDCGACLPLADFERWLFTLLWERQLLNHPEGLKSAADIMRVKGIIYATSPMGEEKLYGLQAVEQMYDLTPIDAPHLDTRTCLVFIGLYSESDMIRVRESFRWTFPLK